MMTGHKSTIEDLPRKRDAEKTRADLLAAAKQIFSTVGYAGGGVREIAALAGIDGQPKAGPTLNESLAADDRKLVELRELAAADPVASEVVEPWALVLVVEELLDAGHGCSERGSSDGGG